MIISKEIHPKRDFYYLGARVIEILCSTEETTDDFFSVYEKLKFTEPISINLFALTLDWLFIIGAIDKPENGKIKKCF